MDQQFLTAFSATALLPREDVSLTSLSGLVDVGLLLHLLLSGTMLHLSWGFGLRLFRTFHTEVDCKFVTLVEIWCM